MDNYTLEEAIDYINNELEEAYTTEARRIDKEIAKKAGKVADLRKAAELSEKLGNKKEAKKFNKDADEIEKMKGILKPIKKYEKKYGNDMYNYCYKNTKPEDYVGKEYRYFGIDEPGPATRRKELRYTFSKYRNEREPGKYLRMMHDKEELKALKKKLAKESVMSDVYEAYCDDVIDAETAMDMILTIEATED